jgi:hypothetical protein
VDFLYRDVAPGAADHAIAESEPNPRMSPVHHQPTLGYRLDDFVQTFGLPAPNLVKIDVDGGEERVVEGARKILASPGLRTVLIEIDEKVCSSDLIVGFLAQHGLERRERHPRGRSTVTNHIFWRA